jgi:outer membrane protein TolC
VLPACWTAEGSRESADEQVYDLLGKVTEKVTGQPTTHQLERPVDTLRQRLLTSTEAVQLTLQDALDVAAENSRDFQRQKESLYLAGLSLTREQHDFAVRFGGGGSAEVNGVGDDSSQARLGDDLSASVNTVAGTRIVASFFNSFLKNLVGNGAWDGSSVLNLTLTQPLLRAAGERIVREPLTQAERDVVYAVRAFERFRADFSIRVVGDYWAVLQQMADLANVEANYRSLVQSREEIEALYQAGRRTVTDLGRAKQEEYSADTQRVAAKNRLATSLDRFKLTLGLPVTAQVDLDATELTKLEQFGVEPVAIDEQTALQLALQRRYDHRTVVDEVEDAGRRILVSEDALQSSLNFTAALNVPAESGNGLNLDWSRVNWAAGFELDLALDKLVERNAYRSSLISFDAAVRARELSEDQITADVRSSLRNMQSAIDSYRIESVAVELAEQRVDATTELYAAGRLQAFDKLDAQDSLLRSRLNLTAAIVDFHVAKLQLMNDLEAITLEATGLRYDPALPMPQLKAGE